MPHPGLPPMQDDAINAFSGREPGGGGLAMAGGPPAAGLAAGPDPGDVEFGESEEMGLSNLADLHRDAMRESARQGRRDTRESRREKRRLTQGIADAEMLAEMGPPQSGTPGLVATLCLLDRE